MAVTHGTATRTALADLITSRIGATGVLVFLSAADVTIATLTLANPAFGAAVAGVATAGTITSATAVATDTIAKFNVTDGSNTIFSGSVTAGGGGGDIIMSSLAVTTGDGVACSSLTYTAPL